jgi:predicted Zn-ribbon and HTH transcriptional regulator
MRNNYDAICRADCDNPIGRHGAKGLCQSHYARWKREGDSALGPLYSKGKYKIERATRGLPEGMKRCADCEEEKFLDEFRVASPSTVRSHPSITHSAKCSGCEYKNRRINIARRNFGEVGVELTLLILDGAGCESCGRNDLKMAIDHDHRCCPTIKTCGKCVRGILCSNCNTSAGLQGDSSSNLRALADYLDKDRSIS